MFDCSDKKDLWCLDVTFDMVADTYLSLMMLILTEHNFVTAVLWHETVFVI